MVPMKQAAEDFLSHKRIAVTGVSRDPKTHGANMVYQRLRERGYDVVAINPNAETVEGDRCYPDLASVPEPVDAVVIGTRPETAEATMHECVDLGITRVWMHRGPGKGSVSETAAAYGRDHGVFAEPFARRQRAEEIRARRDADAQAEFGGKLLRHQNRIAVRHGDHLVQ